MFVLYNIGMWYASSVTYSLQGFGRLANSRSRRFYSLESFTMTDRMYTGKNPGAWPGLLIERKACSTMDHIERSPL